MQVSLFHNRAVIYSIVGKNEVLLNLIQCLHVNKDRDYFNLFHYKLLPNRPLIVLSISYFPLRDTLLSFEVIQSLHL